MDFDLWRYSKWIPICALTVAYFLCIYTLFHGPFSRQLIVDFAWNTAVRLATLAGLIAISTAKLEDFWCEAYRMPMMSIVIALLWIPMARGLALYELYVSNPAPNVFSVKDFGSSMLDPNAWWLSSWFTNGPVYLALGILSYWLAQHFFIIMSVANHSAQSR